MTKYSKTLFKVLFFGLVFLLIFGAAGTVRALQSGGIGGIPARYDPNDTRTKSWFIYNLEPGQSKESALLVINNKDQEATVEVYAVDSKLSNIGQFAMCTREEEKKGVGLWVKFQSGEEVVEATLAAKERKEIPFTITIPKNADVGEHSGAIVVQEKTPRQMTGGGAIVVTRIGTRVYLTVPGEIIKELTLSGFEVNYNKEKKQFLASLNLKNEGNVTLYPKIKLFIRDEFFNKRSEILEETPQLPRGSKIKVNFNWSKPSLYKFTYPGKFSFQAEVRYEGEGEIKTLQTKKVSFWFIPWKGLLILGVIILILLIFFVIRKLLAKEEEKRMQKYTVQSRDTLETIASKFGMNWKKLAKINKLKPPYTLKKEKTLLIIRKSPQGTIQVIDVLKRQIIKIFKKLGV